MYILIFPHLLLSTQHAPHPQAIPVPLFVSMGHACKFFGYSLSILYFTFPWLICNYIFVLLNPLLCLPFSHTHPPISLSLTFGFLITICLGVGLFATILFGTLCASWTCMSISFTKLGKFSFIFFPYRFLISCPFSSPPGIPMK